MTIPHLETRVRPGPGRILFLTLCRKKISLWEIYSAPTLVFSKFRGVVPWKNIQRHWGCNQRKVWSFSKRSLLETCEGINRTLATGTLSRDVCPHGPKVVRLEVVPFFGNGNLFRKNSLAPRNLSGINLGTTPRRHHTRGFWNGFNFCQINTMKWWFISPICSHVFFYMLKSLFLMSYRGSICLSFQYGLYPEYGNMIDYDGTLLW